VEKMTDPVVKSFWVDEFTKYHDRLMAEAIAPIQNKVGQFLSSSLIRNIVGQTKSSFDVRQLMDERKILILNLSKGRIGEDNSALLGAMMITKIQLAAMARVDIPEEERKDFYLYVDEFQNFATESFANILSEARKYRLNLILANQYVTQIEETVSDAIFGNAGTLISFRVGATDAEFLEKEFEPIFMMNDLVNLPKYHIYLKLMIDGIAGDAFSAVTFPPADLSETENNAEKVIKVTRERYASGRVEVEDKITRWSGMAPVEPTEKLKNRETEERISQVPEKQRDIKTVKINPLEEYEQAEDLPARQLFDAVCATCGVEIKVPFEPDGKRPTFCKDCLRDYQRVMARSKSSTNDRSASTSQRRGEQPTTYNKREDTVEKSMDMENKKVELKSFVAREDPLTLSQIQHMAPKKFKPVRQRPQVNLNEVRKLIEESKNGN
jgi:CxxC-x17-CxxC domain-containing protein